MEKTINLELELWRQSVFELSSTTELFYQYCEEGVFSDEEKIELKKMIDDQWLIVNGILFSVFKNAFRKL